MPSRLGARSPFASASAGAPEMFDGNGMGYNRFAGGDAEEEEAAEPRRRRRGGGDEEAEAEVFVGQVKSYASQQGYGFIDCEETFARYSSDVFLHKNQVEEKMKRVAKGDKVRFCVTMNKAGRPQARDVDRYVDSSVVPPTKTFVGRVKGFREDLGYGFLSCEDTRNIFSGDIFIHRNQYAPAELEPGCLATFTIEVNTQGRPQARNVARYVPQGEELEP